MTARRFRVTPNQFQVFKYTLEKRAVVRIEMSATEPVSTMVLDSDDFYEYVKGSLTTFEVERSWPRRVSSRIAFHWPPELGTSSSKVIRRRAAGAFKFPPDAQQ